MTLPFKTRVTDLYGIRLPVIASGLMWLADPGYVAAVARAGLIGFMTAASFPDVRALREGIRRCRELSQGHPFGVNIMIRSSRDGTDRVNPLIDAVIEEGVTFVETAGNNPEAYIRRLKDAGITVAHKAPGVLRYVKKAEALGADAVIVIGAEAGGHPGIEPVGTMVAGAAAAHAVKIPVILAGGIGTGEQLVAALAMGADGVAMGTRFLVSEEIWAHRLYKERLVKAGETDTTLLLQSMRNTQRALKTGHVAMIQQLEHEHADTQTLLPHIMGTIGRKAYETGDYEKAMLSCGQGVVFADRIEPVAAIVDRLETEAHAAMKRLHALYHAPSQAAGRAA